MNFFRRSMMSGAALLLLSSCSSDGGGTPLPEDELTELYANDTPKLFTPMTAALWAEVNTTRTGFGDPNDCQAMVNAIPQDGMVLDPCDGDCIQSALDSNTTVRLNPGNYNITSAIRVSGKNLIGNGDGVVIRAGESEQGIRLDTGSTLSNLTVIGASDIGVALFASSNNLIHQVSVSRTGLSSNINSTGRGFQIFESDNNCIVSSQATESMNEDGNGCETCENGGNADGFTLNFASNQNSIINSFASNNADEGFDFWEGGSAFVYLSQATDNGKLVERPAEDGNGFELGRGSAAHFLYKATANNNNANGFDQNNNTTPSVLSQSTATGNGQINCAGFPALDGNTCAPL